MEKQAVTLITDYLRDVIADVIDDSYLKISECSSNDQADYIITFLITNRKDVNKYFEPYTDIFEENMYPYYKQLMIRLMITDFYEYQSLIKKRGRQSASYEKYYDLINDNINNPQKLVNFFMRQSDIGFNRAIVQNYIIYMEETIAFSAQAIKLQMTQNNLIKLNKINPFYICEVWHFFELNHITEAEEIKNEILQSYYDEYDKYIKMAIDDFFDYDFEEEDESLEEIGDGYLIDFDEDIENVESIIELDISENIEYTEEAETMIGRLTKLHIIQNYLIESKKKLFDVISYIIGNVYENIIYENSIGNNLSLLKKDIYNILENVGIKKVIELFIKDDDFSTLIINFFIEYNEYFNDYDFEQQRRFIDASPYKVKIKKYNKYYNEENSKVEGLNDEIL